MNKRNFMVASGAALLGLALIALPGHTARSQNQNEQGQSPQLDAVRAYSAAIAQERSLDKLPKVIGDDGDFEVLVGDDGASWLGVETHEISADKAKELKLPAEH